MGILDEQYKYRPENLLDTYREYSRRQSGLGTLEEAEWESAEFVRREQEEKRRREAEYQRRVDADVVGLGTSTPLMNILPTKAVTVPLAFGASIIKPIVNKALSRRANKYAGLSMEDKVPLVLKEFPQIVSEGLTNARAIVTRGNALRRELPRTGEGKRIPRNIKRIDDRAEVTARAEASPLNLSRKEAEQRAADRTKHTINDFKRREFAGPSGGKSYWLTEADEKRLYDQLYPHKLREVLEGTPHGRRLTISHDYPSLATLTRGGEQVGSGYANLANLTDQFGNFIFLPRSVNASLGNIVPKKYLSDIKNLLNLK